jgi:hypothetical protein
MSTPGPMPCASANPALIKASCVLPRLGPAPRTSRSRLSISSPAFVTETILAEIGIADDGHISHDPWLDGDHARKIGEAWNNREWSALHADEQLRKPRPPVEAIARRLQRIVGGDR